MASPTGYYLSDGLNKGELKSTVKGVDQAIMYGYEYSVVQPDENTSWETWVTNYVSYTFTGLPCGTRIYGRVGAIGRKDQLAYSDVLSRVVQ